MSLSNAAENAILDLIFNATAWANIADNASSSPLTNLYVSLHTSSPGEAGDQTTNEIAYTSYARVAVARTSGGWTRTDNSISPVADIEFPQSGSGGVTATHVAVGTASAGAGSIIVSGALSPQLVIESGVTPKVLTTSTITLS